MTLEAKLDHLAAVIEENNRLLREGGRPDTAAQQAATAGTAETTTPRETTYPPEPEAGAEPDPLPTGSAGGQETASAESRADNGDQATEPEPESESEAASATLDDLKQAVMQAAKADRDQAVAILSEFGAGKATEVAEQDYDAAVAKLQEVASNAA